MQNLPDKVVQTFAIEFKKTTSVEDMYSVVKTYLFDHRTGTLRGQTSLTIHLIEGEPDIDNDNAGVNSVNAETNDMHKQKEEGRSKPTHQPENQTDDELYTAIKGKCKRQWKGQDMLAVWRTRPFPKRMSTVGKHYKRF